jgi:N-ethylmaleimide reductase
MTTRREMPRASRTGPLFAPLRLGALTLPNRVVMAPMTRSRAAGDGTPGLLAPTYYAQRASAGLIISEAAHIDPHGVGYPNTPGIHNERHVAGWRNVIRAVHGEGGRIFLQLWHVGRISHPSVQPDGGAPIAPSPMAAEGELFTASGMRPFVTPRALGIQEIPGVVEQFARAAQLARDAGCDGVDIHAANGYLIDQFLRSGSNCRSDAYGGSVANRARFLLEVVEAVTGVWGPERVGVRLSPLSPYNSMSDSDPMETFTYVGRALHRLGIGYLHIAEPGPGHPMSTPAGCQLLAALRSAFSACFVVDGGRDRVSAEAALAAANADLVALATPFIANPDLVERLARGVPLAVADPKTFYAGGARGYTDYPKYVACAGLPPARSQEWLSKI